LPYPVVRYRRPWSSLFGLGGLQRLLARLHRRDSFDVLHAMVAHPTGYAALRFHQRTGVPIVVTPRGHDIWEASWYRQRPAVWKRIQDTLRQSPVVTAIGRHMANLIAELTGGRQVPVVHNGISLAAFGRRVPLPPRLQTQGIGQRPYLLGLGRLVEQKGFDVLIRAFPRIASDWPDHDLVIAGDGPLRKELAALVQQHGLAGRIHLPGTVLGDEKLYLLQNCRLTVVPSRYEGYCNVVLESMACGRPVVATRIPSLTEVVQEGRNGTLAEADDPAGLADAVRRALQPQVLPVLNAGTAPTASAHDWPAICQQYLSLYGQRPPSGA